ncbi:hypothetical protein [Deinococcus aetherius]|nr:hypothetical protein [Deinococcus aetherius]
MKPWHAALCAALLSACSPGLDLYTPPVARDYVASCARDPQALSCRAILPTLNGLNDEVTVVLVNAGPDSSNALLAERLAGKGVRLEDFLTSPEAAAYACANVFLASELRSGRMQTLDGKRHTVECLLSEGQTEMCRIDGTTEGFNVLDHANGPRRGSVYLMTGPLPF